MAKCNFCGKDMFRAKGCKKVPIPIKGRGMMSPIKAGDDGDLMGLSPGQKCHDCGAEYGHYHHPGCDSETCPNCGGQLLSCGCSYCIDTSLTKEEVKVRIAEIEKKLRVIAKIKTSDIHLKSMYLQSDLEEYVELMNDKAFFPQ